jgi:two-component system, OmpR family, alkaline phosphatase synthesis response regulator PhoP
MSRVLIIEDNADLAAGIEYNLRREGLDVRVAGTGEEGLETARDWKPGVIILDLMLPGIDGYTVLSTLRGAGDRTPVLILSARAQEADRIRGFRLDADQYVTKPFGLLELIERVKSLMRRGSEPERSSIAFGDVCVDVDSHTVTRCGQAVSLTPREFKLLLALISRDGAVISRLDLLREVWGHRGIVMTRTVDAHVKQLRRKIERDPAEPQHIITVWKIGYRFQR